MGRFNTRGGIALALWTVMAGSALAEGSFDFSGGPQETSPAATVSSEPCTACEFDEACCDPGGFWYSGAELLFLSSRVTTGGTATLTFNDSGTAGTDASFIGSRGLNAFTAAPRLWVGRQLTEKWGIVGRYFYLAGKTELFPETPNGAPLPNFATHTDVNSAQLMTIDLEAVRSGQLGRWKLDGFAGGRYASFRADGNLSSFGVFTTGNFVNLELSNMSSFSGGGFTGALMARRQLFDSPVYFFISGRGSALGGTETSRARVVGTVASSPSAPLVGAATVTRVDNDATMTIGELQTGLQWEFGVPYFTYSNAFFRVAFDYQHWNINSLPVGGAGFGGTIGTLTTNSFVTANHGSASLIGGSVGTGFTW